MWFVGGVVVVRLVVVWALVEVGSLLPLDDWLGLWMVLGIVAVGGAFVWMGGWDC